MRVETKSMNQLASPHAWMPRRGKGFRAVVGGVVAVIGVASALALTSTSQLTSDANWPTYRHDQRRSGVTAQQLGFPMKLLWVVRSKHPPQTAWSGPAKWDAYSENRDLQSMRNFDPCFYVTAVGDQVFYGSSIDDAVHAIDATNGRERWVFFCGSAVRFPPTIANGLAYFGSDDGFAYCCDAASGDLVWKVQASPSLKKITSDRKIISPWPVRTGILVDRGRAYFGASLVPWNASYLWKVDAKTGEVDVDGGFRSEVEGVTLQGALLASPDTVFVPQGRAAPLAFDLESGQSKGSIGEAGGVFCVLTEDEMLLAGAADQRSSDQQVRLSSTQDRRRLATFGGTNRILVEGDYAWVPIGKRLKRLDRRRYVDAQQAAAKANKVLRDKQIKNVQMIDAAKADLKVALDHQKESWQWQVDCPSPLGLIKAGTSIIVGLKNEVRVYSAVDGERQWTTEVNGRAYGLAVAQGRLIVSTDLGHLYSFESAR